jgi:two-component system copper resistance phosphate regulon response regulator CusR
MRILLAEDDRHLAASIARGLREADHDVDAVLNGTDALAHASEKAYDALILDVLLPGRSGLDVCKSIRSRGDRVPVLMLTALDAVEHRIAGLDAGADDYLTKPFDFGELLARLRAITRRHAERAPARVSVGDLEVDLERHAVRRGARDIPLTAKEFALLAYLVQHAGRVITRAELMEHVWGESRGGYSNIIDVYASRLRRKIDDGEADVMFSTVRGVGFLLEAPVSTDR